MTLALFACIVALIVAFGVHLFTFRIKRRVIEKVLADIQQGRTVSSSLQEHAGDDSWRYMSAYVQHCEMHNLAQCPAATPRTYLATHTFNLRHFMEYLK